MSFPLILTTLLIFCHQNFGGIYSKLKMAMKSKHQWGLPSETAIPLSAVTPLVSWRKTPLCPLSSSFLSGPVKRALGGLRTTTKILPVIKFPQPLSAVSRRQSEINMKLSMDTSTKCIVLPDIFFSQQKTFSNCLSKNTVLLYQKGVAC